MERIPEGKEEEITFECKSFWAGWKKKKEPRDHKEYPYSQNSLLPASQAKK